MTKANTSILEDLKLHFIEESDRLLELPAKSNAARKLSYTAEELDAVKGDPAYKPLATPVDDPFAENEYSREYWAGLRA